MKGPVLFERAAKNAQKFGTGGSLALNYNLQLYLNLVLNFFYYVVYLPGIPAVSLKWMFLIKIKMK